MWWCVGVQHRGVYWDTVFWSRGERVDVLLGEHIQKKNCFVLCFFLLLYRNIFPPPSSSLLPCLYSTHFLFPGCVRLTIGVRQGRKKSFEIDFFFFPDFIMKTDVMWVSSSPESYFTPHCFGSDPLPFRTPKSICLPSCGSLLNHGNTVDNRLKQRTRSENELEIVMCLNSLPIISVCTPQGEPITFCEESFVNHRSSTMRSFLSMAVNLQLFKQVQTPVCFSVCVCVCQPKLNTYKKI